LSSRPLFRIIEASDAAERLREASAWVAARLERGGVLIVSASRGAADDLARSIAIARGSVTGLHRFSFAQLAARLAAPVLAGRGIAPSTPIGSEAVAARATFEARRDDDLDYFTPVAGTPGFPRALARTLHELTLARVEPAALRQLPLGGADLAALLERFEDQFSAASATDRAALFEAAARSVEPFVSRHPLLLLDVPMESAVEFHFAKRLIGSAPEALLTVPFGDLATLDRLEGEAWPIEVLEPPGSSDLTSLKRHLFARRQPPIREAQGDVRLFSAPGEERECVEIARRILAEARTGVRFDEMAVFLRSPREYVGLLEHAFERAGIPAWFDRGTRRPHPSGRAFLSILSCAVERLSALRFSEYLSLAQVPGPGPESARRLEPESARGPQPLAGRLPFEPLVGADDAMREFAKSGPAVEEPEPAPVGGGVLERDVDAAVVDGMLRAPWKWEQLIVESAVIGGDPRRWHRRLDGLAEQFQQQIREEAREDPDSPRLLRLGRDLRNLRHLCDFALPVVDELAAWPASATWSEWLDRFEALAPRVLRKPARVLRVLAELRPMGAIGPVTLEEARDVLSDRLRTLDEHPPAHRYGRVFVGSPHQARGRAFRVVFVPGLAERMFPQKPREDPMLLDEEMREPLGAGLPVQDDRAKTERLLLRLAVGAANERAWLSYPRIDLSGARPRVPSFYVLDIMRAITGRIPNHEAMQREAAAAGQARLDWPAPPDPSTAIDQVEHDLSTLRSLIEAPDRSAVRGHGHYLLRLNDALRRSVTVRWARNRSRWMPQDGIVRVAPATKPMLDRQRLGARPYSLSALQKFATCPYQFFLSAIYRMEPNEEPEPLQRMDPLTRGALFHEVQAGFFRELRAQGRLPLELEHVNDALGVVDRVLAEVAADYHERLAPAIERVWNDEVAAIGRDLRVWVRKLPEAREWTPEYFEFSFGLADAGRDPRSVRDPVRIDGRFLLRGSVDVVETRAGSRELRVTDHKTGRDRTTPRTVIGGGSILQPVVYSLAVEQILGRPVAAGRLFYCTAPGGFTERVIPLNDSSRRAGIVALEIVDRAIELGFLPPAPADRACAWCDFRSVCGPDEPRHVARKPADRLGDLNALREMP
jgi:CRISPR/Cas system-associated exonuclease Cas4 (RecB family)